MHRARWIAGRGGASDLGRPGLAARRAGRLDVAQELQELGLLTERCGAVVGAHDLDAELDLAGDLDPATSTRPSAVVTSSAAIAMQVVGHEELGLVAVGGDGDLDSSARRCSGAGGDRGGGDGFGATRPAWSRGSGAGRRPGAA